MAPISVAQTGRWDGVAWRRGSPPSSPPGEPDPEPDGRADAEDIPGWRDYLRGHATVTRALEAELLSRRGLSLAAYDVLVRLAAAPERRLRMTELAAAVLLSRSGVTRLVDRLEREGLVSRCRVREDGRGVAAALTAEGYERMRAASGAYRVGVRRYFADRLDPNDLHDLRRISERLAVPASVPLPAEAEDDAR